MSIAIGGKVIPISCYVLFILKCTQQAGAELCQAQVKLEDIVEVVEEAGS